MEKIKLRNILSIYLKFFFLVGSVYILWTIPRNLNTEREITLTDSLTSFLIFGLGMSLILVTYHLYSLKDLARINAIELKEPGPHQQRHVCSSMAPSILHERLKQMPDFAKAAHHSEINKINFKTGFNGKSWGDQIEINYQKKQDHYIYHISSKPRFFFTMIDFGQNLDNVIKIEKILNPIKPGAISN
ncbi:hypothetical protein [Christiangramia sabulilitoris]|uniref:Uncharacterized protein n=1 Tax=Christiangramia sabulilitoris TaxID=2583991 RepID=A0A550I0M4_9FLAO|nr:hypothetical protein [Christiangramia sabulilitoris]TRO64524.1 hypothetical protein FGM01_13635 [Christiangramia sabulilitoris]